MSGYSGNPYARPPQPTYNAYAQPSTSAAPVAGPSYAGYNQYQQPTYDYSQQAGPAYDPAYLQQSSAYSGNSYVAPSDPTQSLAAAGAQGAPAAGGAKPKPTGRKTVLRKGGGGVWEDQSLLEWDPAHFRLFVGDLDPALSDELFEGAFRGGGKYASFVKAKIIREKHTNKGKGFGFVSYSDPEDFLKAWKDLNGKYIGTRPVTIKKATAGVAAVNIGSRKAREFDDKKPKKTGSVPYSKANAEENQASRAEARSGALGPNRGKSWIRR